MLEALLNSFFTLMKDVVPLLLRDAATSEGAIAELEGLTGSIRCFDAQLANSLKLVIDKLRIPLNVLMVIRADLKASVVVSCQVKGGQDGGS